MTNETTTNNDAGSLFGAKPRRRILAVHWDGAGNVPPQRAIARELQRRGAEVHVLSHDSQAAGAVEDGTQFHKLRRASQWDFSVPHSIDREIDAIMNQISGSADYAEDFAETVESVQPDVCLIDAMLMSCIQKAIEQSLPFAVVNHLAWNLEGACGGFLGTIAAALPGAPARQNFWSLLGRAPLVLATSYLELGTIRKPPPRVHFVGPVREPVGPATWRRRLADRKLVVVSLSSGFQGQEATLEAAARAVGSLPVEALITTGRGIDPARVPGDRHITVERVVPHDEVMPMADLAVTHAGLGTLMFALGAGVPCLCLPNGRDQDDNARRIVELGLGRALPAGSSSDRISEVIAEMLEDETLISNARTFAAKVKRFGNLEAAADLVLAVPPHREPRTRLLRTP